MRLHHLEVTAFGPFADRVTVDFDALSEAGLFLLSGATGAGKSSVLDAVCFALYGDVPGDRATAKRLRSDHAADDVVPRVVLEATLAGRRFRIDRSPAWTRPKKRGTGTTTEQARVVVAERTTGADGAEVWSPLSTRLDEAGHLLTRLVGMTLPQFCQVAMLPQGRFQAFLRARSEERHALLQQVFATGRFDDTEKWLRERRVEVRRDSEAHRAGVADLVSRVSEVGDDQAPEEWTADPDLLLGWVASLTDQLEATQREQADRVAATASVEAAAASASTAGAELAGRRATYADAVRARADLAATAVEQEQRRHRVEQARRAATVQPLHTVAREAEARAEAVREQLRGELDRLAALVGDRTLTDHDAHRLGELHRSATQLLADLARVRPLVDRARDHERELADIEGDRATTAAELARVTARSAAVPAELAEVRPALDAAQAASGRAEALTRELAVLGARVVAGRAAHDLRAQVCAAEAALAEALESRLLAREALVEIREQRLDGMAAEIAGRLAVGACCPVCGSADHPSPAAPSPGAPDEATEREARRAVDDLEVVVEAHAQQVRGLETRLASAQAEAAAPLDELVDAEAHARAELEAAERESARLTTLSSRARALEAEHEALRRSHGELTSAIAALEREAAVVAERITTLREQVRAVVPEGEDLDALVDHHRAVERLAHRCSTLATDVDHARSGAVAARDTADEHARAEGFASAAEAAEAWLDDHDRRMLRERVEAHDREAARLSEVLTDPALVAAAEADPPDLERLAGALREAREDAAAAREADARLRERSARLTGLRDQVAGALAAWAPVRADLDLVADLSALVEGKHPDNRLQMRLSAYVLAHRLGQVVEAANLRLASMSDQRYSLLHTGRRGAGERRGGLSLLVRDDWTGEHRDPATLSGGETFVVSLALALGLADVITGEAGGTDLDTLFVDEGFGSLDSETLEDVMDTLDTLRDGGRVVGVVSHVPELQTRIPTQLRVHRSRTGSRASLHVG